MSIFPKFVLIRDQILGRSADIWFFCHFSFLPSIQTRLRCFVSMVRSIFAALSTLPVSAPWPIGSMAHSIGADLDSLLTATSQGRSSNPRFSSKPARADLTSPTVPGAQTS